jgi:hypothetical protein
MHCCLCPHLPTGKKTHDLETVLYFTGDGPCTATANYRIGCRPHLPCTSPESGDVVELFDGTGNGYRAKIESVNAQRVRFAIEKSFRLLSESSVQITLAQGFLKDRKMDEVIRQLTELGIDCWMPFYAARSVPVPGKKGLKKRLDRWEKIALAAVKQCRRGRLPEITPVSTFDDMLAASAGCELKSSSGKALQGHLIFPAQPPENPKKLWLWSGRKADSTPTKCDGRKRMDFSPPVWAHAS